MQQPVQTASFALRCEYDLTCHLPRRLLRAHRPTSKEILRRLRDSHSVELEWMARTSRVVQLRYEASTYIIA